MMNKIVVFFVAITTIIVLDLFHFEAPPNASQEINGSVAADSLAAFGDAGVNLNTGLIPKAELNMKNSDDTFSVTSGQMFDPVTMLLLGSGLIGLAGLGRKKI